MEKRWVCLKKILKNSDVQASHDGLEDFKPGPALGRRGFEVVHDRRLQAALVTLFPGADVLHGERATADAGLGATGRETLYERAPELGREARSERLGKLPGVKKTLCFSIYSGS